MSYYSVLLHCSKEDYVVNCPALQHLPFYFIILNLTEHLFSHMFNSNQLVYFLFLFSTHGVDITSSGVMAPTVVEMWRRGVEAAVPTTWEIFPYNLSGVAGLSYLLCRPLSFWTKYITPPIYRNITPFFLFALVSRLHFDKDVLIWGVSKAILWLWQNRS